MSRIGKLPVALSSGVSVNVASGMLTVKGPKGELSKKLPPHVSINITGDEAVVERANDSGTARAMHGLTRSLLANMVTGVPKATLSNCSSMVWAIVFSRRKSILSSHWATAPYSLRDTKGLEVKAESPTAFTISGIDKESGKRLQKFEGFDHPSLKGQRG